MTIFIPRGTNRQRSGLTGRSMMSGAIEASRPSLGTEMAGPAAGYGLREEADAAADLPRNLRSSQRSGLTGRPALTPVNYGQARPALLGREMMGTRPTAYGAAPEDSPDARRRLEMSGMGSDPGPMSAESQATMQSEVQAQLSDPVTATSTVLGFLTPVGMLGVLGRSPMVRSKFNEYVTEPLTKHVFDPISRAFGWATSIGDVASGPSHGDDPAGIGPGTGFGVSPGDPAGLGPGMGFGSGIGFGSLGDMGDTGGGAVGSSGPESGDPAGIGSGIGFGSLGDTGGQGDGGTGSSGEGMGAPGIGDNAGPGW